MTMYLYHLRDGANRIRYVGKSDNPYRRLLDHLYGVWCNPSPLSGWLRKLLIRGEVPAVRIVAATDGSGAADEAAEICRLAAAGVAILNVTANPALRMTMREKKAHARRRWKVLDRDRARFLRRVTVTQSGDGGGCNRSMVTVSMARAA